MYQILLELFRTNFVLYGLQIKPTQDYSPLDSGWWRSGWWQADGKVVLEVRWRWRGRPNYLLLLLMPAQHQSTQPTATKWYTHFTKCYSGQKVNEPSKKTMHFAVSNKQITTSIMQGSTKQHAGMQSKLLYQNPKAKKAKDNSRNINC